MVENRWAASVGCGLTIVFLASSCVGDGSVEAGAATSEEGGARRFEVPASADTLVPDLRIGSVAGPEEVAFASIRDVAVGPEGTVYVLEFSDRTVRVFDSSGGHVRTMGGRGQGPGELQNPRGLALAPDGTIWVFDDGLDAVLALAPDGTELSRHPLPRSGISGTPLGLFWDGMFRDDGVLTQTVYHNDPVPREMGLFEIRSRSWVLTFTPSTGALDSLYVGDDPLRPYRYRYEGADGRGGTVFGVTPFDPRRLITFDRDGRLWTALSTSYRIVGVSPTGDSLVLQAESSEVPASADERAGWEEMLERAGLEVELPARTHVMSQLFADDERRLWVQRHTASEEASHFDVFAPDGSMLGSVRLPGRLASGQPTVRGGYLYAVVFDELLVPSVVRAPVPRFRR